MKKTILMIIVSFMVFALIGCGESVQSYSGEYEIEGSIEDLTGFDGHLVLNSDRQELVMELEPDREHSGPFDHYTFQLLVIKNDGSEVELMKSHVIATEGSSIGTYISSDEYILSTKDKFLDNIKYKELINNLYARVVVTDYKDVSTSYQTKLEVTKDE